MRTLIRFLIEKYNDKDYTDEFGITKRGPKSCPKCGGKPVVRLSTIDGIDYYVECSRCNTQGEGCDSKEEAIYKWNHMTRSSKSK